MSFEPGSIVRARDREWVVLPESDEDWLMLRPLGGAQREVTGIYLPLEGQSVGPAVFPPPDPTRAGDHLSGQLLRDAVRLSVRAGAGPFRSFARIAVEPRPYQLVPLLMALRLPVVRLLIADDVGIGKTVEASLIARELLDRGEVERLCVLCPPHLAEQWQSELREKFHIDAELVLSSTVARLERGTAVGQSLFDVHPHVIVSQDYIKSPRRRDEFVRACPELVIVDEAHGCAAALDGRRTAQQQRHQLVQRLAADAERHLLLVTATPHSGNEGAFRSLLGLLDPDFLELPADLSGRENERHRRRVAAHLVQRRRADIRHFLQADTAFPERLEAEATYSLSEAYRKLFDRALDYARERVQDESGDGRQRRVRWWSALALLRSLASSPAAAASTLRSRSSTIEARTEAEVDEIGARAVMDLEIDDTAEFMDAVPGSRGEDEGDMGEAEHQRLLRMAREAERLMDPEQDRKLDALIEILRKQLSEGFNPIVFCRFIATAEYVAEALRQATRGVEVAAVTGTLPPAERELRVARLGDFDKRVLVATDCLSEGVNLQDHFDAVIHYDLSWNPTIHEQREGRVDRYGQPSPEVRALTLYGVDNQIDGMVLDVLLRKHKSIRTSLGISVPLPAQTGDLMQALMNGLLLRGGQVDARQLALFDLAGETYEQLHSRWENVAQREKQSRTLFAQRTIDVEEVGREWEAVRRAIGTHQDVARFVRQALRAHGGVATWEGARLHIELPKHRTALLEALRAGVDVPDVFEASFELPTPEDALHIGRRHPLVEGLASHVIDTALDPLLDGVARRCGASRSRAVDRRTTLLLLRSRYRILSRPGGRPRELLAEEGTTLAFRGAPASAEWLDEAETAALLDASVDGNILPAQIESFVRTAVEGLPELLPAIEDHARARAHALAEAHERVRAAADLPGGQVEVEPHLPVDVLGIYVLLPV